MLTEQDLAYFEALLLVKRKEVLARTNSLVKSKSVQSDTNELADEVDLATLTEQHRLAEQMLDRDYKLIREIEGALQRIKDGEYGYCEGSGDLIPRKRLEVQPWCRYTVAHQEKIERQGFLKKQRGFNDE